MRAFSNPTAQKLALTGAVAVAGLLLSACGSANDSAGDSVSRTKQGSEASVSGSPAADTFNDADVAFAQAMIPHHQQALEMARLADGRAEDTGVKKIVADVEKAQDPEIRKMRAWLKGWGRPESTDQGGHGAGHGGGHSMAGMMSEQDMKELANLRGTAFDRKFAELMIAHHEGAVEMAETEQKDGRDATAKKLAADVVRTQTAEIAELRKILDRL
ncbi:DUF305 domain-containing protein [Streptomyces sp. Je 1-79]|uniref:DUF305 domain-containing protein n=1 Tax=Streptomyces sp. Je 1-79 TaxID=2943847 RepID=UPI0021A81B00|nr:DUF305 domain-containing protein [Streptomyces sp. Je 1-79]MCT4353525.1 DUF305 domain-containing protein [Streptomyces sp. Je 1-79]